MANSKLKNEGTYLHEIKKELEEILDFWRKNASDEVNGGFVGKMSNDRLVDLKADKGCVLNARILWTFSSSYIHSSNPIDLALAKKAFEYIRQYFIDKEYGGCYWSVDLMGEKIEGRKQIYSQAFTIYGLTEFYKATQTSEVLNLAKDIYYLIEKHSFDANDGGYWEAFSESWEKLDDLRLSEKDINAPKTMNTHLHIIEAYCNLFLVWPDENLKLKIINLLTIFNKRIIQDNGHMHLFFDANWKSISNAYSFGHDIEASWLLHESAKIISDKVLIENWESISLKMVDATMEGLNTDGSLNHEYDPDTNQVDTHREWWVSAEGMVGFLNAYQISNESKYLDIAKNIWSFIKTHLKDMQKGEWFWGVLGNYSKMNEDKIGFWKCPYHNVRACLEIIRRIESVDLDINS